MKKIAIIIALLALLGGATVYYISTQKKALSIEDILPEGVQLYVYADDVEGNIQRITSSKLWQAFAGIDYNQLIENQIVNAEQAAGFKEVMQQLADPQLKLALKKIFGHEFALAVYPITIDLGVFKSGSPLATPTFIDDALSNFMIVTRVATDVQMAETLSGFVNSFGENTTKETLNYKDFTVHSVVFTDLRFRISYFRIKDLLVICLGERPAQRIIDIYTDKRPSLKDNKQFARALEASINNKDFFVYWDMDKFASFLKEQSDTIVSFMNKSQTTDPKLERSTNLLEEALSAVAGFNVFMLSGRIDSLVELKFNMIIDQSQISQEMASLYSCALVNNKSLQFIPKETMAYQWSSCMKLALYWDHIKKEIAKAQESADGQSARQQIDRLESLMGLSIERDILPAFGEESGGYLEDIGMTGFPLPKLLLFVKVADKAKVDKLLSLLTQNPLMALQREDYSGMQINYFSTPIGGSDIEPCYSYLDDFLLIAINRKMLKKSIDAKNNQSVSLSDNQGFKEVNKGLTDANLSVFFVQMGTFINRLEDLIEWGNNWEESQTRSRAAYKAGSEQKLVILVEDIVELKEGLKEIEGKIEVVNKTITDSTAQGLAIDASQEELKNLTQAKESKEKDIVSMSEQRQKIEDLINTYKDQGLSSEKRTMFMQKLVYPILGGLSSIESIGGRSTANNDLFESTLIIKAK